MRDVDQTIDAVLDAEERDLLRRIGEESGAVEQILSLFGGRTGWLNILMMAGQFLLFAGGLWTGWRFFQAADAVSALHWGLPAAVLLLASLMIKLALWPEVQANRVLLALKRVELLIVQSRRG